MTSAAVLGAKLYGLELWEQPHILKSQPHGNLFISQYGSNNLVWVEVLFVNEKHEVTERFRGLEWWSDWIEPKLGRLHLIALKAGDNGLIELHNGLWQHDSLELVTSRFAQDTVSDFEKNSSEPIQRRTDEESSAAFFGLSSIGDGGSGGFGGGRGGGEGGGNGPEGQAPGAGGVREMLNHPVLFTSDRKTLRSILENT
ncbi:hypothetical protein [Undibacterium sp. YM2]|uniref:hypothetical protein n=1 Tax=Undibacterium sp. YM2 TaxID=2058625 RepID=UPI001389BAE9|nr:hypothetical protein [Undibacterium sp. YM2]